MDTDSLSLHEALERLARAPDADAWAALIHGFGEDLRRLAARLAGCGHLADDAVQQTLLQVRTHAGRFRVDPHDPEGSARRWLMGIAAHAALSLRRSAARRREREKRAAMPAVSLPPAPDATMDHNDLSERLRDALAELPPHERLAVSLRHLAGLDYPAIAQRLDCPMGTAKARVSRGLDRLRHRLARGGLLLALTAIVSQLEALDAPASAGAAGLKLAATFSANPSHAPLTTPFHARKAKVLLMASIAAVAVLATAMSLVNIPGTAAVESSDTTPLSEPAQAEAEAKTRAADDEGRTTVIHSASVSVGEEMPVRTEFETLVNRLAGMHRPNTKRSAKTLDDGRIVVETTDHSSGKVELVLGTPTGERIWQGPVNTEEERQTLPTGVWDELKRRRQDSAEFARKMAIETAAQNKAIDLLLAPYAGTYSSRTTMSVQGVIATTIDRNGSPWMIATDTAGQKLWEGPVATEQERQMIPPEIARALGYEDFRVDSSPNSMHIKAVPVDEAPAAQ